MVGARRRTERERKQGGRQREERGTTEGGEIGSKVGGRGEKEE